MSTHNIDFYEEIAKLSINPHRIRTISLDLVHLSRVIRKPPFCICENKDADQLRGNREADQRLCFRYIDSTTPSTSYIRNFKPLAILCDCTAQFVWDQVRIPEDWFSHNEAHL